ncbi:putative gustatory receptor 59d [Teleopsis dalmanni]|uniref:putative gustatory receptor 59d n=1 Tax=Teleopsis dalmanni TaxID=139649 RepID=UPI0018CFED09|nr:putative gustatory receptor 59d [Teleopsis dalmanni]
MALRWKRDKRFEVLTKEMFGIDARYFDKTVEPLNNEVFDWLYYAKFATAFSQAVIVFTGSILMSNQYNLKIFFLSLYVSNTQYVLHGVMFHYFSVLWHGCRRYNVLNAQLVKQFHILNRLYLQGRNVLNKQSFTLQQLSRLAAADLYEISRIHCRLTTIIKSVNDSYKYQTIAVLLTYLVNDITVGYYVVIYADGSLNITISKWGMVAGIMSYAVLFIDLYLFYWICDKITRAYQETSEILRELHALPKMDDEFMRHCEIFSLQLMQHKLLISMGGMFNLSKQASLALWSFSLRHTLILVQFDYENRFRILKASVAMELDEYGDMIL